MKFNLNLPMEENQITLSLLVPCRFLACCLRLFDHHQKKREVFCPLQLSPNSGAKQLEAIRCTGLDGSFLTGDTGTDKGD